jgi:hypothetical protein
MTGRKDMNNHEELIFVYNADSSIGSMLFDYFHKLISPNTYPCGLCYITYGRYGVTAKKEWKKFIESLPYQVVSLHKDELIDSYPDYQKTSLPAVFGKKGSKLSLLIDSKRMDACKNLRELKDVVKDNLVK